jgi:hypothetical protein
MCERSSEKRSRDGNRYGSAKKRCDPSRVKPNTDANTNAKPYANTYAIANTDAYAAANTFAHCARSSTHANDDNHIGESEDDSRARVWFTASNGRSTAEKTSPGSIWWTTTDQEAG